MLPARLAIQGGVDIERSRLFNAATRDEPRLPLVLPEALSSVTSFRPGLPERRLAASAANGQRNT